MFYLVISLNRMMSVAAENTRVTRNFLPLCFDTHGPWIHRISSILHEKIHELHAKIRKSHKPSEQVACITGTAFNL